MEQNLSLSDKFQRIEQNLNIHMDEELRTLLIILGFDESLENVPSLSEIRRQFRKESLVKHPDKTTGSKDKFQKLLSAYQKVEKCIAQQNYMADQMKDISEG